ncbi:MAG: peptidyl-alpha-hydroxyglycine alpha-amidating lyase family protein [Acidobacteria bacterium]|nr:peptidyl-alpha-hydroxyglycine alpha-amidating lyase family protein [Acidobacteriota bacterium]
MDIKKHGAAGVLGVLAVVSLAVWGHAQSPQPQSAYPAAPTAGQNKYPHLNVADGYRFVPGWPQKPAETIWKEMSSMARDASGNIWTLNRGEIPIQIYRPDDGALVKMWGQGEFKTPHQLRFDRDGSVWVTDSGNHTVKKFTPDGKLLMTLGVANERGVDSKHFDGPTDLAISPTGDLFISDGYGNNRIVHYDKTGRFVKTWGTVGIGPGQLSLPHGIAMDSKGRLYVVERNNARIQVFDQSGKSLAQWRNIMTPWAITIMPNDEVYVVGSTPMQWWETFDLAAAAAGGQGGKFEMVGIPPKDQIVVRFDTTGRVLHQWSFPKGPEGQAHKPGELLWVHGFAVAPNGDLYLGDVTTGRTAQKFAFIEADARARWTTSRKP